MEERSNHLSMSDVDGLFQVCSACQNKIRNQFLNRKLLEIFSFQCFAKSPTIKNSFSVGLLIAEFLHRTPKISDSSTHVGNTSRLPMEFVQMPKDRITYYVVGICHNLLLFAPLINRHRKRWQPQQLPHLRVHHLSIMREESIPNNLIL